MNKKISLIAVTSLFSLALLTGCNKQKQHVHQWNEPTYTWTDDHSSCAAERICSLDETHNESETVNSVYAVVDDSTCSKEGLGRYTATFTNSAFQTQYFELALDKKAHTWDEGEITRFPTIYTEGEKTYHCLNCDAIKTEAIAKTEDKTSYTLDAERMEDLTGVFTTKAAVGADKSNATIGIPLFAKQNLVDYPTYESPGIIQGAVIDYEKKTGPVNYEWLPGNSEETLVAPYCYFRYSITKVSQKDHDGNTRLYDKLSGFDGTYYIIRVDVSDLIEGKTGYLHVKEENNKALMVRVGMQNGINTGIEVAMDSNNKPTITPTIKEGYWWVGETKTSVPADETHNESLAYYSAINDDQGNSKNYWFVGGNGFADGMGIEVSSYPLKNNAEALKDKNGNHKDTPYVDIIVLSSGKLAAGADYGKQNAPTADISLSFYIDNELDHNPSLTYDPTSQDTNHAANVMKKFFDESKAVAGTNATSYLVKGDDIDIDVETVETKKEEDVEEFWSLDTAIGFQDYNEHTIKLLCEVPVLEGLDVHSINEEYRRVILDVNSFDIQIANHSTTGAAGLIVRNNASLEILDNSRTVGAELAIGNNATMEIQDGGTFIIDSSCQLEVEFDAASKVKYTVEKLNELLAALPSADAATDNDKNNVISYFEAYNLLSEEEQAQITPENKAKLDALVAKFGITQDTTPLNNGQITVKNGGTLINEGIINIEGLEVKPQGNNSQETGQTVIRDIKTASLFVEEGGVIDNYGNISVRGDLFLHGTLNNYGKYDEIIEGTDPDKGTVDFHKGIQVTWKDDVTVEAPDSTPENKKYTVNPDMTRPGIIHVGKGPDGTINQNATLNNYGDIVLCPGYIYVDGTFKNIKNEVAEGCVYICDIDEAVVPVTPVNPTDPLEERREFSPAYESIFDVKDAKLYVNDGHVYKASIELIGNGIFGKLTVISEINPN